MASRSQEIHSIIEGSGLICSSQHANDGTSQRAEHCQRRSNLPMSHAGKGQKAGRERSRIELLYACDNSRRVLSAATKDYPI